MKAYELIQQGWTQKTYARNGNGQEVTTFDKDAVQFCLLGAMIVCYPDLSLFNQLIARLSSYLAKTYKISQPTAWNDKEGRTQEEVVAVLKFLDI